MFSELSLIKVCDNLFVDKHNRESALSLFDLLAAVYNANNHLPKVSSHVWLVFHAHTEDLPTFIPLHTPFIPLNTPFMLSYLAKVDFSQVLTTFRPLLPSSVPGMSTIPIEACILSHALT